MLGPVLLLSDTFGLMLLLVSCRPDQVESLCGWDCSWSNLDWISNVLSLVSLIDTLTNDNCLSIQHLLSRMMSAMTRYSWVFCFLTLMVSWQLYSQEPHPEGNVSLLFYKWIAFMGYFCISELFFVFMNQIVSWAARVPQPWLRSIQVWIQLFVVPVRPVSWSLVPTGLVVHL